MSVVEHVTHVHPHTHEEYGLAALEIHLTNWHDEESSPDDWEPHTHESKVKENRHYADRIDCHPWAANRLSEAEVVFFGIEGCPKADSMLADILKNGWNASVVSVPSVSMWDAPELSQVAKKVLRNKTVVIVPDGDWATKVEVENQAKVFQSRLYELGVKSVLVAAPPLQPDDSPLTVMYQGKEEELKGVDDYLGLSDGSLADLVVLSNDPPEGVAEWVAANSPNQASGDKPRKDGLKRRVDTITALALCSGPSGEFKLTVTMLARYMNVPQPDVTYTLQELQAIGALEVRGSMEQNKSMWNGALQWAADKPTLILHPDLRAKAKPSQTLADVLPELFQGS